MSAEYPISLTEHLDTTDGKTLSTEHLDISDGLTLGQPNTAKQRK
jgi:hypothetical protein